MKALLLENIHPVAVENLEKAGFEVELRSKSLSEDELVADLPGVTLLGIRSNTHITPRVLDAATDLKAIGCFCIGTNQVDLDTAMQRGIPVFNAPFSNTRSVAELVLGEAILLLRRIPEKNARVHLGHWDKSAAGAFETRGKTLGIVGYGHIGSQLSVLAEALGLRVRYYDVVNKLPLGNAGAVERLYLGGRLLLAEDNTLGLVIGRVLNAQGTEALAYEVRLKEGLYRDRDVWILDGSAYRVLQP